MQHSHERSHCVEIIMFPCCLYVQRTEYGPYTGSEDLPPTQSHILCDSHKRQIKKSDSGKNADSQQLLHFLRVKYKRTQGGSIYSPSDFPYNVSAFDRFSLFQNK